VWLLWPLLCQQGIHSDVKSSSSANNLPVIISVKTSSNDNSLSVIVSVTGGYVEPAASLVESDLTQ